MDPLVSVVVTTYNQARYIEEALESALGQTYPAREVIVVDDGSIDDTPARIARFGDRVRYVRQRNAGIAGARNAGVRQARGELVAFLDGDDVWELDKLAVQVAASLKHPAAGLIAVDGVYFGEDGLIGSSLLSPTTRAQVSAGNGLVRPADWHEWLLEGRCIPTVSQVMLPRHVLEDVGPSDPRFALASDYDLYLRISQRYDAVLLGQTLVRWRYVATSASGPWHRRELNWTGGMLDVLRKHRGTVPARERRVVDERMRSMVEGAARRAYYVGREQDPVWARRYLVRLLRKGPRRTPTAVYLAGLWCPEAVTRMYGRARRGLR